VAGSAKWNHIVAASIRVWPWVSFGLWSQQSRCAAHDITYVSSRRQEAVFRLGEKVTTVEVGDRDLVQVGLESGKRVHAKGLLYAAGRQVNTDLLDLAAAGLESNSRGRIEVNEHFQSAVDHIYAAGDCIGFPALAATSMLSRPARPAPAKA